MAKKKTKTIEERIIERPVLKKFEEGKKWSELINVSDLITIKDNPNEFLNVLGKNEAENPGCYKWWAKKDDVEELLRKKLSVDEKLKKLFRESGSSSIFEKNEENLYCIYVGKANNLYDRLRDHAKNTRQSTLRRTICSLKCNQNNSLATIDDEIDNWLTKFKLQYFSLLKSERTEDQVKGKSGKQTTIYKLKGIKTIEKKDELSLLDLEYFFINEKFHILNVDENHFTEYREKKGSQLKKETVCLIKEILAPLKNEKKKWTKEKITKKKEK